MQLWKRRIAVVLAVGAGSAGLMMTSAGAQVSPPSFPDFTFPTFPPFPTFTTFSIPPPTMPPSTSPSTSTPPPTMPPPTSPPTSSPPPTMPPITSPPITSPPVTSPFPDIDEIVEDLIDRIENLIKQGEAGFEEFQELLDQLRSRFID